MNTTDLATRAVEEANSEIPQQKNHMIMEEVKDTDWSRYEYLDIAIYPTYDVVTRGDKEFPSDFFHSMGMEMMAMRYTEEPNDYEFYSSISDYSPEVLRINREYGMELIAEWD